MFDAYVEALSNAGVIEANKKILFQAFLFGNELCLRHCSFLRLRLHPLIVFLDEINKAFHGFGFGGC